MRQRFLIAVVVFAVTAVAQSQDADKKPASPKSWQATAAEQGLSSPEIELLKKNDLLLTNHEHRQIYEAYSPHPQVPLFITSDSLLNAYHVLFEESFVRMEHGQGPRLAETLRLILTNLEQPRLIIQDQPELNASAQRLAKIVIGVAIRLLDSNFRIGDAELDQIIANEAAKVEAAEVRQLPEWLVTPSAALFSIDYKRFKPRSFYTRSVSLERYFRAVSWLQAIPFRVNNDNQLLAILLLGDTLNPKTDAIWSGDSGDEEFGRFGDADISPVETPDEISERAQETFWYFYAFVGKPDLPDIVEAADQAASFRTMSSSEPEMSDEESTEGDSADDTDLSEPSEETGEPTEESSDDPQESSKSKECAEEIILPGKEKTGIHRGQFGGGGGFGGLSTGGRESRALNWNDLKQFRESLREHLRASDAEAQINDQVRLPPDDPNQVDDLQFRVISAGRTPDGILFHRTTDLRRFDRPFPSGLEVAIALGSSSARTYLTDPSKEQVLQEIESCRSLFHEETLYGKWMYTLMSLLDAPDRDAPAFMGSDAWQRKSCNTVLASWTQQRHTLALHAKLTGGGGGGFRKPPPGFVEPDPEFFSRMAELARRTQQSFREEDLKAIPPDCRPLMPVLESLKGQAQGIVDSTNMELKLQKQLILEHLLYDLAWGSLATMSEKDSDLTTSFHHQWNQTVEKTLDPAKVTRIRTIGEGVDNPEAMKQKLKDLLREEEEEEEEDSLPPTELLFALLDLTKVIPQKSSSWSDHWKAVCDEHLPQVVATLKSLSEGIETHDSMQKAIEDQFESPSSRTKNAVTRMVLKQTTKSPDPTKKYSELWDNTIDQLILQIQDDSQEKNPALTAILDTGHQDLSPVWDFLIMTSLRLEVIAQKQLRGVDLNETEISFLLDYGGALATIMLQFGRDSKDDAPWAISVYTNHELDRTLHAATSRPRILYVLYPWKGTKILTRGAVLPYREVISQSPLTDTEWRDQLNSNSAPPLPDWLQPILSPAAP